MASCRPYGLLRILALESIDSTRRMEAFSPVLLAMKTSLLKLVAVVLSMLLGSGGLRAQTNVRPEPSGKRILFVDGDTIRPDPSGNRLLFIDGGDTLRPNPSGERLLFVDHDGDIRHSPGGVRLACWDGDTLRRTPAGPILLVVDGGDTIRPTMNGPRMYFFDGPKLSKIQITAVLYQLKPELFKLSAEEIAAKEKKMAENGKAEEARLAADPWVGDHQIAGQNTTATTKRTGSIAITKQGDFYAITYKTGENPAWSGIGAPVTLVQGADPELWAAVAPSGAVSLGTYAINGGNLTGTWIPVNADHDKAVLGFENLAGAPQLGGVYKITGGKLPNGGAAYTGALNIDPLPATFSGTAKCYRIRWATGTSAVGFVVKNHLTVAAGWGADWEVLRFRLDTSALQVDLLNKTGAEGSYTIFR